MSNITSVSPSSGPLAGGTTVIITGTGFTGTVSVDFGPYSASFTVDSDTQITATAPDASDSDGGAVFIFIDGVIDPEFDGVYTYAPVAVAGGDCLSITVGSFIADGVTPDVNGVVYTVEDADGWWSIPTRSATMEAQPRGEAVTIAQELGRAVTLTIVAHALGGQTALGAPACFAAMEAIKTAFRAVFTPVLLSIVDPTTTPGDAQLLVRRVGPIKQQILGTAGAVRFSIPLLAENPVKVFT